MPRWMVGILAAGIGPLAATDTATAKAWYACRLDARLFAIRCRDNKRFLVHGTIQQVENVGNVLCKDHGGLAGPGGGPHLMPAPADIRALVAAGCRPGPIRGAQQCGRVPEPKAHGKKTIPPSMSTDPCVMCAGVMGCMHLGQRKRGPTGMQGHRCAKA